MNLPTGCTQRDIDDAAPGFASPGCEDFCEECRSRRTEVDENGVSYTCDDYGDCGDFRTANLQINASR